MTKKYNTGKQSFLEDAWLIPKITGNIYFLAVSFPDFLREVPNQKAFTIIFTPALEETIDLQ